MATALKNSFEKSNPEFEFKIFDVKKEKFIISKKKHLKGKKNLPKRLQIRKI